MTSQAATANPTTDVGAHSGAVLHDLCVACGSGNRREKLAFKKRLVSECASCGLQWQRPQPSNAELAEIYGTYYFIGSDDAESRARKLEIKRLTAALYLDMIEHYRGKKGGDLLEVGCGQGEFLVEAMKRGYSVTGVEYSGVACATARESLAQAASVASTFTIEQGEVETSSLAPGSFDLCVMNDVLEHVREPQKTIARARALLRPGGTLFIATPSLDSWSAKLMGRLWMEYKDEHLFFFSKRSAVNLLNKHGFSAVSLKPGYKVLTLEYVAQHFEKFPVPGFSELVKGAVRVLPKTTQRRPVRIVASGLVALASAD